MELAGPASGLEPATSGAGISPMTIGAVPGSDNVSALSTPGIPEELGNQIVGVQYRRGWKLGKGDRRNSGQPDEVGLQLRHQPFHAIGDRVLLARCRN